MQNQTDALHVWLDLVKRRDLKVTFARRRRLETFVLELRGDIVRGKVETVRRSAPSLQFVGRKIRKIGLQRSC